MDVVVKLRREVPPASSPRRGSYRPAALPSDKNSPVAQAVVTRSPTVYRFLISARVSRPAVLSIRVILLVFPPAFPAILAPSPPPVKACGDAGSRTPALRRAKTPLSHLSYIPRLWV